MTLWAESIHAVGAGVSTVLVNVQVVILPLLAFLVLGERVRRSFVLLVPVMLAGIALAGGLADGGAGTGVAPVRGTVAALLAAVAYAGYLLLIRLGSGPGERFGPVGLATAGATASSFVVGSVWQGVDLTPGWAALGWLALLAVVGQVMGWVLIASAPAKATTTTPSSRRTRRKMTSEMIVKCIECGRELDPERAALGYRYCTKTTCQSEHRRGVAVTAVAVNKSGDSFRVADPDEIEARAAAGEFGPKNTSLGLGHQRLGPAEGSGRAVGGQPRRRMAPAVSGRPGWSPAQAKVVRLYSDMGLSPRQIVERARENMPRLGITESLAVQILSVPRRR